MHYRGHVVVVHPSDVGGTPTISGRIPNDSGSTPTSIGGTPNPIVNSPIAIWEYSKCLTWCTYYVRDVPHTVEVDLNFISKQAQFTNGAWILLKLSLTTNQLEVEHALNLQLRLLSASARRIDATLKLT